MENKYKQYSKYFQEQKTDSPLTIREDEVVIKLERFNELTLAESRCKYLERLVAAMDRKFLGDDDYVKAVREKGL